MKNIAIAVTFIISILVGMLPILLNQSTKMKVFLRYCDALTVGLFLGVGFTHLLPEAVQHFNENHLGSSANSIFIICAFTVISLQLIERTSKNYVYGNHSQWLPYFLVIVLSIHSVLEGFVLGFENDPSFAMTIFIAIIAHKGAESFSLITNMITQHISTNTAIITLVLFSAMTPLGIFLGQCLLEMSIAKSNLYIQPYFDAMAAGTFIYVALVCNPYHAKNTSTVSAILTITGFSAISYLASII